MQGEGGYSLVEAHRLLIAVPSLLQSTALGHVDSVVAASRLGYPEASGIFLIKPVSSALPGRVLTTGSSEVQAQSFWSEKKWSRK